MNKRYYGVASAAAGLCLASVAIMTGASADVPKPSGEDNPQSPDCAYPTNSISLNMTSTPIDNNGNTTTTYKKNEMARLTVKPTKKDCTFASTAKVYFYGKKTSDPKASLDPLGFVVPQADGTATLEYPFDSEAVGTWIFGAWFVGTSQQLDPITVNN